MNTDCIHGNRPSARPSQIAPLISLAIILFCAKTNAATLPARVDFNYHLKPLLSDRCYFCHGPDEKARKGKLRLDTKEGALKALEDGMSVIKPGDTAHSEMIRRITSTIRTKSCRRRKRTSR